MKNLNRPQFTTANNLFGVSLTGGRENTGFQVFIYDDGVWNVHATVNTYHLSDLIECLQKANSLLQARGKKHKWGYKLATKLTRMPVEQLLEGQ
jgi:hypothetical protein